MTCHFSEQNTSTVTNIRTNSKLAPWKLGHAKNNASFKFKFYYDGASTFVGMFFQRCLGGILLKQCGSVGRWVSIFEQATGTNETCWFASGNVCFKLPCVHLRLLKGMLTSSCLQDPQKWSNESSYAPSLSSWHQGHRGKKLVGSCSSTTQRLGPSVCVFLKNDGVVVGCRDFLDVMHHWD